MINKNKMYMGFGLIFLVSCGNTPSQNSQTESIRDVASMNLNSDGTYTVFCSNGTWEKISATELHRNDMCPNSKNPGLTSNISSLVSRNNGSFDVVCKDGSKTIALGDDIVAGKVCVATDDPFDVNSCKGSPMTLVEAAKYVAPSEFESKPIAKLQDVSRVRKCHKITGCTPWREIQNGLQIDYNSSINKEYFTIDVYGNLNLNYIDDSHGYYVSYKNQIKSFDKGFFETDSKFRSFHINSNSTDTLSSERYLYILNDLDSAYGSPKKLVGLLTNQCLRISGSAIYNYSAPDTWAELETVIFAKF